ncbi:PadR family transcriptional regulator [Geodermatophilus sp. YIM 151500]|uniref:PadR family transcriptional regulator n=1 Tax=Geodermatophilus sp. YIM 151500 TaxID=2984531 RepID=UPI0021E4028C|nr:PadR family transcriptional regulator [Geodermatophilus sp. YIM 151500]MCV2490147.1 PadR family transcriptional regulator [Geodermatophilus sp. YIM 151500]
MSDDGSWPPEWMRAALPLCVLAVVAAEETYGYAVAQRLHAAGLGTVKGGTLYPVLNRLEQEGLLRSAWREGAGGPGRKFYTVTEQGSAALAERTAAWHTFAERAGRLLPSLEAQR